MSSSPMHLNDTQPAKEEREGLPIVPVLIFLGVAALIAVTAWQIMGQHPVGTLAITKANALEMPGGQRVVVEVELAIQNTTDKPLKYHSTALKLVTDQEYKDEPASYVETPRIYQSYPALKQSNEAPLKQDTIIGAGETLRGVAIVAFPVSKAAFDGRKSLDADAYFYDQSPIHTKK